MPGYKYSPSFWQDSEFEEWWDVVKNEWEKLMNGYYENACSDKNHFARTSVMCIHQIDDSDPKAFVEERLKILQYHTFSSSFYDRQGMGSTIIGCLDCAIQMLLQTRLFVSIYDAVHAVPPCPNTWVSMEYVMSTIQYPSIMSRSYHNKALFQRLIVFSAIGIFRSTYRSGTDLALSPPSKVVTCFYFILKIRTYRQFKWFITVNNGFCFGLMIQNCLDCDIDIKRPLFFRTSQQNNMNRVYLTHKGIALHLYSLFHKYHVRLLQSTSFKKILSIPLTQDLILQLHNYGSKWSEHIGLIKEERIEALQYLYFVHYCNVKCSQKLCSKPGLWHKYRHKRSILSNVVESTPNGHPYALFLRMQNVKPKNKWYKCAKCRFVFYCSRRCQKRDWKNHKQKCNQLANLFVS
eukprot:412211_1